MEDYKKKNNSRSYIRKNLKKYFFSFTQKLYKPSLAIVSIQFLIIIFFSIDNYQNIKNRIPIIKKYLGISLDTFEIRDYGEYFSNLLGSFVTLKKLERIDLSLSFKDKQKLDCDRAKGFDCYKNKENWVKAHLNTSDEIYKVKLRAKGDRNIHRINLNQMSFKVDIRGEKRFKGMEEFSIQSPIIRNYTLEALAAKSISRENIITPRHYYVRLFINGEYVGVRHIEETISRELIESSERRYGPVFSIDDSISTAYENSVFDLTDRKTWPNLTKGLPAEALSVLRASREDNSIFNKYFDIELWGKLMAKLDSLEMFHGTVPKSTKFYLNPTTGLIEPIFFDGHYGAGLFGNFKLIDVLQKEKSLIDCRWTCENLYFYRMMFGTPEKPNKRFITTYLESLERYTSEKYISNLLRKDWDELWLERGTIYREGFRRDGLVQKGLLPHIGQFNKLNKRLINIRNYLKLSKIYEPEHSFSEKNKSFIVKNSFSRFPQIYKLYCEDRNLDTIILVKNHEKEINLPISSKCLNDQIYFSIDGGKTKKLLASVVMDDFDLSKNLQRKKSNPSQKEEILFNKGKLNLKKNKTIMNSEVKFIAGSEFCLENDSILHIINSEVILEGTVSKPNFFGGCGNKGGSIIIEDSVINFGNMEISNLNFPDLKLFNLFGGINIINSKMKGDKFIIKNSLSEDGINFVNSIIDINNLEFKNIKSDALDSDFSELKIGKISCNNIGNDCLDLSYSNGVVTSIIGKDVKDKVISLGENSFLKANLVNATNSAIGIVSKDNSKLFIDEYDYDYVSIPIAVYIKKKEFGSPFVSIKKLYPLLINKDFISKDSKVYITNKEINGEKSSSNISNLLYGNLYGVKTKR